MAGDELVMAGDESLANATSAWTPPTGMTTRLAESTASTAAVLVDQPLPAAGATGNRTATVSSPGGQLTAVLIGLRRAPDTVYILHDQLGSTRALTVRICPWPFLSDWKWPRSGSV